ncbi:MAG: extracellular solute-binding protein [Candidatus Portnoybacteria bacterium]|nr:extracellular solute-binding protein [Candidatus Portnoybacteria bacterium]
MFKSQNIIIGVVILVVIVAVVLILVFLGIWPGFKLAKPSPFTLEMWGFDDEDTVWRNIIRSFQDENSYITVHYTKIAEDTYENILLNRLAENKGPDIFMLKNTNVLQNRNKIYPLPQVALNFSINNFNSTFVDVAHNDLIDKDGSIYGVPLYVDSLALFYNKDIFNATGIAEPPRTWDDIIAVSRKLTQISSAGDVARSGIALGTVKNIAHALEIISAMILQKGESIVHRNGSLDLNEGAQEALGFYTSFADRTKQDFTWSNTLPNSLDAFAEEKTAMFLGFAEDIAKIKEKNPHIKFGITAFPQLTGTQKPVTFGSYAFLTLSKLSKHPIGAWNFMLFAVKRDNTKLYLDETGRAPARRDILASIPPPFETEIFWRQVLIAKSWSIPNYPTTISLFQNVIEALASHSANLSQAFNQLREQLRLLLP